MENDHQDEAEKLKSPAEDALKEIEKKYVVLEKSRLKPWQTWLVFGLVVGAAVSIIVVANKSGKFFKSSADVRSSDVSVAPVPSMPRAAPKPPTVESVPGEFIIKIKQGSPSDPALLTSAVSLSESGFVSRNKLQSVRKVASKAKPQGRAAQSIQSKGLDRLVVASAPTGIDANKVLETLRKDPEVEYAEPNYVLKTQISPNDPYFSNLWGLHNTGQTGGKIDADIDGPEAWDYAKDSSVVVGVIDTGVDYTHEDLAANMWKNPGEIPGNGIDDDKNGYVDDVYGWDFINGDNDPMDDFGHGTHVAGTIGGVGNNGIGIAGVNWSAKIAALKFLSSGGSGTIAGAVEAVTYANMMGFKITSNSWGGGGFSQALYDAIAAANTNGGLFIAAAGNNGSNADQFPMYPAAYDLPNIISVAATDHNDDLAFFSNYGVASVDLGAPGVNVFSSVPKANCALCNPSGYISLSGTSMATPHVSGAAALLWQQKPLFTHAQIKTALMGGGEKIPALAGKTVSGRRLNLGNLFEVDTLPPAKISTLKVNPSMSSHNSVTLEWKAVGDDGIVGTATLYDVRYSTAPINDTNFGTANKAPNIPAPLLAGAAEKIQAKGLAQNTLYYFAVKAIDNVGNISPLSNVVFGKTLPVTVVFDDDMEKGDNGWVVEGSNGAGGPALWHRSMRRAVSPTSAWYYGDEVKGNFNTGARNYGTITSPVIDLTTVHGAELSFGQWLASEPDPWDQATVLISTDPSVPWAQIFAKKLTGGQWSNESVDISAYDGKKIQLRFSFDTVDAIANDFEGWYIDDVKVVALKGAPKKPVAKVGGPYSGKEGDPITFNGSQSFDPFGKPLIAYKWDFGNGSSESSAGPTISYGYLAGGSYKVSLVVNNGLFDSATSSGMVTVTEVNNPPVTKAAAFGSFVGVPIMFDASGSYDADGPITSYSWNFGDGSATLISNGPIAMHKYAAPGTYPISLTVSDGVNNVGVSFGHTVHLYDMFDRADGADIGPWWSLVKGAFKIVGESLHNVVQGGYAMATILSSDSDNVSADFKFLGGSAEVRAGVILRYKDTSNYYLLYRRLGNSSLLRISKFVAGKETILTEVSADKLIPGSSFRLGGYINGQTIVLQLNGITRASVNDATFSSAGHPGILVGSGAASEVQVDNVYIPVPFGEKGSL